MIAEAMGNGVMKARDLLVLTALVKEAGPLTGQCYTNAKRAVDKMNGGMTASGVTQALVRLKKAGLVKRFLNNNTKAYWYAVNPRVYGFGTPDAQRRLWEKWQADKI